MIDQMELPPRAKVYELDPSQRYVIDIGPDVEDELVTKVAKLCADKSIKALVAGGRISITVTPIEEGVTYVVKPDAELPRKVLEQMSKNLNNFGLRAMVVPKGVMFSIEGDKHEEANG